MRRISRILGTKVKREENFKEVTGSISCTRIFQENINYKMAFTFGNQCWCIPFLKTCQSYQHQYQNCVHKSWWLFFALRIKFQVLGLLSKFSHNISAQFSTCKDCLSPWQDYISLQRRRLYLAFLSTIISTLIWRM